MVLNVQHHVDINVLDVVTVVTVVVVDHVQIPAQITVLMDVILVHLVAQVDVLGIVMVVVGRAETAVVAGVVLRVPLAV